MTKVQNSLRIIAENQPEPPKPWTWGEVVGVTACLIALLQLGAIFGYGIYATIRDLKELQQ